MASSFAHTWENACPLWFVALLYSSPHPPPPFSLVQCGYEQPWSKQIPQQYVDVVTTITRMLSVVALLHHSSVNRAASAMTMVANCHKLPLRWRRPHMSTHFTLLVPLLTLKPLFPATVNALSPASLYFYPSPSLTCP